MQVSALITFPSSTSMPKRPPKTRESSQGEIFHLHVSEASRPSRFKLNANHVISALLPSLIESFNLNPSVSINASNSDEYFLQHSLIFAESLKDLKNIRLQLHSAADYFESSYMKHEHKQLVEESLKDYITKALVNTVDHLGSVACKVNGFLDDKGNEISSATLRFSSIEQTRVLIFFYLSGEKSEIKNIPRIHWLEWYFTAVVGHRNTKTP
ncbi:hypothetical protein M9H77_32494 [Catharanthus roseus]|uniref:Uncharacterized protein n=1 Tax=Catharanthus roseus TaxID=4058 RepID=A0ACC0A5S8_CATRO|nr:hypothetical protein M9H77_32494 [Catharanthus roseus]